MIVDAHAHLDLDEITGEEYIRVMDQSGVAKMVLLAGINSKIPPTPDFQLAVFRFLLLSPLRPLGRRFYEFLVKSGNLKSAGVTIRIIHDPDNESVARTVAKYPDRFIGFVVVNPRLKNAIEIFEKGIEDHRMVGVKCNAWWHRFDPSQDMLPVAKRCEEKGLPLLIHLGGGPHTSNFQGLLDRCPRLKLILAHAGIPLFQESWQRIRKEKNCFVDISGPYLNAALVRKTVMALGPDKVLFGSDGPSSLRLKGGGYSYEPILQWTRSLPVSDADKERIFYKNLAGVLP